MRIAKITYIVGIALYHSITPAQAQDNRIVLDTATTSSERIRAACGYANTQSDCDRIYTDLGKLCSWVDGYTTVSGETRDGYCRTSTAKAQQGGDDPDASLDSLLATNEDSE